MTLKQACFIRSAMCVQRFDDSQFCNSHYVSHFAAFFIVVRAKISVAESYKSLLMYAGRAPRGRSAKTFLLEDVVMCVGVKGCRLSRGASACAHATPHQLHMCIHRFKSVGWWIVDRVVMILPQVHLRKPCYDFTFL